MFNEEIKKAIDNLGFRTFTPIQESMFEAYLKHEHIIGLAPTGTGKTLAYLLPILNGLDKALKSVQAVICVPTNDLVLQVEKMVKALHIEVDIKAYVSGKDRLRELEQLTKRQPQLVIATPGKLEDYAIKENKLKIHTANYFVLDEADMMLDLDFMTTLDKVFYAVKASHLWMFSATLPDGLDKFINRYFGQSFRIDLKDPSVLDITHGLIMTKMENKDKDFLKILSEINPYIGMVFVSRKETIDHVYNLMVEAGYSVVKISGETKVKERSQILEQVRNSKYRFIVSSDIASRGIDLEGVTHVINYELPYQLEFYIHRSGRTGRATRSGIVYTLYTNEQARKIQTIEKKGIKFTKFQFTKDGIEIIVKKSKGLSEEEVKAIKKIKKPTKVTPNYKKKNKEKLTKAKRIARYGGK
ncbi:MAG: DEAD/DEAH box helicase [Acholeplasma sp.]|nr:DEAD/DEAH box helicase [Acholeplasma sp.]